MRKREEPQIAEKLLIPVLSLNTIDKGRMIYLANDQKEVHWQLNGVKVEGIDNDKQVLICRTPGNDATVIPFSRLSQYFVMKLGWDTSKKRRRKTR
jgi:hypothetical protein